MIASARASSASIASRAAGPSVRRRNCASTQKRLDGVRRRRLSQCRRGLSDKLAGLLSISDLKPDLRERRQHETALGYRDREYREYGFQAGDRLRPLPLFGEDHSELCVRE